MAICLDDFGNFAVRLAAQEIEGGKPKVQLRKRTLKTIIPGGLLCIADRVTFRLNSKETIIKLLMRSITIFVTSVGPITS